MQVMEALAGQWQRAFEHLRRQWPVYEAQHTRAQPRRRLQHPHTRFVSAQVRISCAHAVERRALGSGCPGERPVPHMRARTTPAAGEPITTSHPTALAQRNPPAPRLSRSAFYICSPPRLCPIPSAAAAGHIGALLDIGATHGVDLGLYASGLGLFSGSWWQLEQFVGL